MQILLLSVQIRLLSSRKVVNNMKISGAILNILRNKTRSILTMSGIAIGVFSVVIISAIGTTGTIQINSTLVDMGINSILVEANDETPQVTLSDKDVETLRQVDGVSEAMPLMASVTESLVLDSSISCLAWGVSNNADEIISLEAMHGRLINTGDIAAQNRVCVIDKDIAMQTYGRTNVVGKSIRVYLGGSYREFEIVGIAKSGISSLQSMLSNIIPNFVYLPYTTMQSLCGRSSYDKIAVLVNDESREMGIVSTIEERLSQEKGIENGVVVNNLLQQKSQLDGIMGTITAVLSIIAGISLVVSGLSVMTTMLVSVSERTREIGIKKSIGARNLDILQEFILESMMITVIGSGFGAVLGIAVSAAGCFMLGLPVAINGGIITFSLGISLVIGLLFGAYPAYKAAKLSPVDALKN